MNKTFSGIKQTLMAVLSLAVIVIALALSHLPVQAAGASVTVGSAESTDSSGYYKIPISISGVTLSSGKSLDISLTYNNMRFTVEKTEFSSSVKSYGSVSAGNPYGIKIKAGSSSLKLDGTVCTVYFKPIGTVAVSENPINATVTGASVSVTQGKISVTCEHSYEIESTVAPTCTSDGYTVEKCNKCGEYTRNKKDSALGHDNELVRTVEPDCTQHGYGIYECKRCHLPSIVEGDAPLGHEYGLGDFEIIEPTCAQKGYTEYRCLREGCDATDKRDYTDPIDHTAGEPLIIDSTCQKHGSESVYCTQCGFLISEVSLELVPHNFDDTVVEPTCASPGYTHRKCSECHVERRENPTPKTEHSYTAVIEKNADCVSSGRKKFTCVCGDAYVEEIPMLGHNYVEKAISPEEELESDMIKTYVCTVCGASRPQVVPNTDGSTEDIWGDGLDISSPDNLRKMSGRTVLVVNIALVLVGFALVGVILILVQKLVSERKGRI